MVEKAMGDSEWQTTVTKCQKIYIDDAFPNICILQSRSKALAGGLISPREFVDLLTIHEFENKATGYQTIQTASRSIKTEDIPEQKGYVRGNTVIRGCRFERLSDEEMKQMELPKLMVAVKGSESEEKQQKECEWTRVRYIFQTDPKGRIPKSLINATMSHIIQRTMRDVRNFVIRKKLGLDIDE